MKELFPLLAILLFLSGCTSKKAISSDEDHEIANSVLWRISEKSLAEPSYLLGTIHMIPEDMYFWTEEFDNAFQASGQIAMEIDMAAMDPAALLGMMSSLMMSEGQLIGDLVTKDEYQLIEEHFEGIGLPFMLLERIKPFFLYVFVTMDMGNMNQGSMKSYELEIMEKAKQTGKPTTGLETLEFQVSIFDSIPYTYQANMLVEAIMEKEFVSESSGGMQELFQAYVNQDLNTMYAKSSEGGDKIMEDFNHLLIDKRNIAWIPNIEKMIREKPTFIAVGAGHLAGPKGVIRLLRKAGYTLTPITTSEYGPH